VQLSIVSGNYFGCKKELALGIFNYLFEAHLIINLLANMEKYAIKRASFFFYKAQDKIHSPHLTT
jgi:hypothetical protein